MKSRLFPAIVALSLVAMSTVPAVIGAPEAGAQADQAARAAR